MHIEMLPKELQITTKLLNYGGKEVTIVAANIDDVEELKKDATVQINSDHKDIPEFLRIAAFQHHEAIILSIEEEIPFEEAVKLMPIKNIAKRRGKIEEIRKISKAA